MTKRYETQCWYCKSRDMEDKGDYVQCRSCGATWNYVPLLERSPVVVIDAETGGSPRPGRTTRYRPHGSLIAGVARKRGQKVEPGIER